ncbi:MAG: hypothetical protein ACK523_19600 [Pirellulaceae bacterium]
MTPSPKDSSRFQLDRYPKLLLGQVELLTLRTRFNESMMEVVRQQIEQEVDPLRKQQLADAFEGDRLARTATIRSAGLLQEKSERYAVALSRLDHLLLGRIDAPGAVDQSWKGFWFLISRAQPPTLHQLVQIPCAALDRKAKEFHFARGNASDAPASIGTTLMLLDWARKRSAVPLPGSRPQKKMQKVLECLAREAADALRSVRQEVAKSQKELDRIAERNWSLVVVEQHPPKDPLPA